MASIWKVGIYFKAKITSKQSKYAFQMYSFSTFHGFNLSTVGRMSKSLAYYQRHHPSVIEVDVVVVIFCHRGHHLASSLSKSKKVSSTLLAGNTSNLGLLM